MSSAIDELEQNLARVEEKADVLRRPLSTDRVPDDGEIKPTIKYGIQYRRASDIKAKPVKWVWQGRFARGKVGIVAGNPGLGKSQLSLSMAAIVSTGGVFPDGTRAQQGNVIILSAEDDAADTIRPRLEAAGADLDHIYILEMVSEEGANGETVRRAFNLKADLLRLEALIETIGNVQLVVIDPISAYLSGVDTHLNAEVRAALAPLSELAGRHAVAIVGITHLNKTGNADALMRITGSIAFVAAARAAYLVARDDEDDSRRLFLPLKNNLGSDRTGLAFKVEGHTLGSGIETCRITWESEAVTITADEALATQAVDRNERDDAKAYLENELKNGPVPATDIQRGADANGISRATLRRAKKDLCIEAIHEGKAGAHGKWFWRLGTGDNTPKVLTTPQGAQYLNVSPLAESEHLGVPERKNGHNGHDAIRSAEPITITKELSELIGEMARAENWSPEQHAKELERVGADPAAFIAGYRTWWASETSGRLKADG